MAAAPLEARAQLPAAPSIEITSEERAWLDAHAPIRVAFDGYFPPYSFNGPSGSPEGFAPDVVAALVESLGVEIEVVPARAWSTIYESALHRDIDVVATMVRRPTREAHFGFTEPYIFKTLVIVAREGDERIRQPENLAGKTVAMVERYQYAARILDAYPTVTPQYYETMVEALNAVSMGSADAAVTYVASGHYVMSRYMLTNQRFAAVYDAASSNESIAVRGDWPELVDLFDRALAALPPTERISLERRWFPPQQVPEIPGQIALTDRERAWIAEHRTVRVGVDPEFRPFEFIDEDGRYRGMAADYLALLGPRLGLNFDVVPDLRWDEVIARAEAREIDLLPSVAITPARAEFLRFSPAYTRFQRVIVTQTEHPFLRGVDDLAGLRVAVQEDSSHDGYLDGYPRLDVVRYPSLEDAIRAVAAGDADALVGNVAPLTYWIRELNLTNLKVAGATSGTPRTLHIATRSDWPILAGLIQKGLASMSEEEHEAIAERWTVVPYEVGIDRRLALRSAAVATVVIVLLVAGLLLARRQNRRVADARDEALRAGERARAANEELSAMRDELEDLVRVRTAERIAAERRFQEAQKMEALGTLVGGIAHDFNNILSGMLGSMYVVSRGIDDEVAQRRLEDASALGMRGADLIRQLLAVARRSGGQREHLDLVGLVEEIQPILRTSLPKRIALDVSLPEAPLIVLGNVSLLQQIVLNLVNNARDALEETDEPMVSIRVLSLGAESADGIPVPSVFEGEAPALIEVADNGPGVPEELSARVFEPFFTTKPAGEGTGLGLAMVFGAVEEHGGVVEVHRREAGGSAFRVFLPRASATDATSLQARRTPIPGEGESILLVDDDAAVRESHAAVLVSLGYEVWTAADGEEALGSIEERMPDLVLLDVLLPRRDGLSTRREIARRWPALPVLFLSAYDPSGELPESLERESYALLQKPCTPDVLSRAIRERLDARS